MIYRIEDDLQPVSTMGNDKCTGFCGVCELLYCEWTLDVTWLLCNYILHTHVHTASLNCL